MKKSEIDEALNAGYHLKDIMRMVESRASAELEGAKTRKSIKDLLDLAS